VYEPPPFAVNAIGRKRWSVLIACVVAESRTMLNFAIEPVALTLSTAPASPRAGAAVIAGRLARLPSDA
jgi:hypothetical protein